MRRLCLLSILLLAGCQGLVGPRQRRDNPQPVNDPSLTMDEQQRRTRDRLALPEPSTDLAPRTYTEIPQWNGR
ncbi:MAG: hypothetical protein ACJ8FY_25135 [Gemmataceae bacterium]